MRRRPSSQACPVSRFDATRWSSLFTRSRVTCPAATFIAERRAESHRPFVSSAHVADCAPPPLRASSANSRAAESASAQAAAQAPTGVPAWFMTPRPGTRSASAQEVHHRFVDGSVLDASGSEQSLHRPPRCSTWVGGRTTRARGNSSACTTLDLGVAITPQFRAGSARRRATGSRQRSAR